MPKWRLKKLSWVSNISIMMLLWTKIIKPSLNKRLPNSRSFLKSQTSTICSSTHSLQASGRIRMSKRVFFASSLAAFLRNSSTVEEVDSEEKSTFSCAVTRRRQSLNFCNMCIKSHLVVSIRPEKEVQLSVSQSISQEIQRLKSLCLKVAP